MFNINNKNLISLGLGLFVFACVIILIPKNANAYNCTNTNYNYTGTPFYSFCGNNSGSNSNNNYNNGNYNNGNYNNGNSNGYNNNNAINPIPFINSISPNSGRINTSVTVTVSGSNFVQSSVIRWNGSDRPTTFINSGTLRTQLYSSDLNSKGTYLITVYNPAPGGGFSNAMNFTVNNAIAYASSTSSTSTTKNISSTKNTTTVQNTNQTSGDTSQTQVKDLAAGAIFGSNAFMPSSLLQWIFFAILILLAVVLWRKLYVSDEERHHSTLKHA